jgi:hypothetical protein
MAAADYDYFRIQASYALSQQSHAQCTSSDPWSRSMHAYAQGYHQAQQALRSVNPDQTPATAGELDVPAGGDRRAWLEGIGAAAVQHFDHTDSGKQGALERVAGWLESLSEQDRHMALAEATWVRAYAHGEWSKLRSGEMDAANLQAAVERTRTIRSDLRVAMLQTLGRKWARAITGWHRPREVLFPESDAPNRDLEPFARGFGEGLAEKWGPHPTITRPRGLPRLLEDDLAEGYRLGLERRWLVGREAPELLP